jgi:hypothetical protein
MTRIASVSTTASKIISVVARRSARGLPIASRLRLTVLGTTLGALRRARREIDHRRVDVAVEPEQQKVPIDVTIVASCMMKSTPSTVPCVRAHRSGGQRWPPSSN